MKKTTILLFALLLSCSQQPAEYIETPAEEITAASEKAENETDETFQTAEETIDTVETVIDDEGTRTEEEGTTNDAGVTNDTRATEETNETAPKQENYTNPLARLTKEECLAHGYLWDFVDNEQYRQYLCMNEPLFDVIKESCLSLARRTWEFTETPTFRGYVCVTTPKGITKETCEARNDSWERRLITYGCYHYYTDGGKACTSSNECESKECLVDDNYQQGDTGTCKTENTDTGCTPRTIERISAGERGVCW